MGHLQHHFVELLFGLGIPFYSQGTCDPIFHTYKTGAQLLPLYFIEDTKSGKRTKQDLPNVRNVQCSDCPQLASWTRRRKLKGCRICAEIVVMIPYLQYPAILVHEMHQPSSSRLGASLIVFKMCLLKSAKAQIGQKKLVGIRGTRHMFVEEFT